MGHIFWYGAQICFVTVDERLLGRVGYALIAFVFSDYDSTVWDCAPGRVAPFSGVTLGS